MEYNDLLKLKSEWGEKTCDHPRLEKVRYAGAFLITWACVKCGAEFTIAQKMELYDNRKKHISP